jgi:hypothetical protein
VDSNPKEEDMADPKRNDAPDPMADRVRELEAKMAEMVAAQTLADADKAAVFPTPPRPPSTPGLFQYLITAPRKVGGKMVRASPEGTAPGPKWVALPSNKFRIIAPRYVITGSDPRYGKFVDAKPEAPQEIEITEGTRIDAGLQSPDESYAAPKPAFANRLSESPGPLSSASAMGPVEPQDAASGTPAVAGRASDQSV